MTKFYSLIILVLFCIHSGYGQRKKSAGGQNQTPLVDSIAFHLYTDSLKKGVHNYINIDGKLSNGSWYPLSDKDLLLTCSDGSFEGNSLVLPADFDKPWVTITATYRRDSALSESKRIYIKTKNDDEQLKSKEQIMEELRQPKQTGKKKRGHQGLL